MPAPGLLTIGSMVIGRVADYFQQKRELKDATHQRRVDAVKQGRVNEAIWNQKHIEGGAWRANYMTIVLSMPLILVFFPPLVPYIEQGFDVLDKTPVWYRGAVAVMISAAFGYQKYADWQMRKAYAMPSIEEKI